MPTTTVKQADTTKARAVVGAQMETLRLWLRFVCRHQLPLRMIAMEQLKRRKSADDAKQEWSLHNDAILRAFENRLRLDVVLRLMPSILWMDDWVKLYDDRNGTGHVLPGELADALRRSYGPSGR